MHILQDCDFTYKNAIWRGLNDNPVTSQFQERTKNFTGGLSLSLHPGPYVHVGEKEN